MSIASIFNDIIEIYRSSSTLYTGEIAEVDISRDPAENALIHVTLDSEQSGTIYLNGSTVEMLAFSNSKYAESTSLFTELSGVTPASLSGEMQIDAFNEAGEPLNEQVYINSVRGYFAPKDNQQYLHSSGMRNDFKAMLFTGGDTDIRTGDIIRIDGEEDEFTVESSVMVHGVGEESHREIVLT